MLAKHRCFSLYKSVVHDVSHERKKPIKFCTYVRSTFTSISWSIVLFNFFSPQFHRQSTWWICELELLGILNEMFDVVVHIWCCLCIQKPQCILQKQLLKAIKSDNLFDHSDHIPNNRRNNPSRKCSMSFICCCCPVIITPVQIEYPIYRSTDVENTIHHFSLELIEMPALSSDLTINQRNMTWWMK